MKRLKSVCILNYKIAAAYAVGIATTISDHPLKGMHPVVICCGVQNKVTGSTVTIGIKRKKTGNIRPVNIIRWMAEIDTVYVNIYSGTVRWNSLG